MPAYIRSQYYPYIGCGAGAIRRRRRGSGGGAPSGAGRPAGAPKGAPGGLGAEPPRRPEGRAPREALPSAGPDVIFEYSRILEFLDILDHVIIIFQKDPAYPERMPPMKRNYSEFVEPYPEDHRYRVRPRRSRHCWYCPLPENAPFGEQWIRLAPFEYRIWCRCEHTMQPPVYLEQVVYTVDCGCQ